MRKLLIFGILAIAVVAAVVMVQFRPEPPTVITLFLIPCLYLLQIDGFIRMRKWKSWVLNRPESDAISQIDGT
jgi:hypothetical protein